MTEVKAYRVILPFLLRRVAHDFACERTLDRILIFSFFWPDPVVLSIESPRSFTYPVAKKLTTTDSSQQTQEMQSNARRIYARSLVL